MIRRALAALLLLSASSAFATDPQFGAIRIEAAQDVRHAFVSSATQGSDASKVSANEWNAAHTAPAVLVASVPTGFVWPGQPAALTEFCGASTSYRWRANLTAFSTIRLTAQVISGGAASSVLRLQYTTDLTGAGGWAYMDGASGPSVAIDASGVAVSSSVSLATAAKADVLLRLVGLNGDGAGGVACYSTIKAATATLADSATTATTATSATTATTATALAANGANCSAGSAPLGVDASGAVEGCFAVPSGTGTVSGTNTGDQTSVTGNAGTATALAANGANCPSGNYPLGVDASGAVEDCTAIPAGGLAIGTTPITSGTATRVLRESSGNVITEDANLTNDGSTVTVGTGISGTSVGLLIDNGTSTGSILVLKDNGTTVLHTDDGGTTYFGSATTYGVQSNGNATFNSGTFNSLTIAANTGGSGNSYRWGAMATTGGRLQTSTSLTPDGGIIGLGTTSNSLQIAEEADVAANYDFQNPCTTGVTTSSCTDPAFGVRSHNQAINEFISIGHNAANAVVYSGLGPVALKSGTAVASATALPLPTGNVFHVTGTTTITSITTTGFSAGMTITLIFDGILTFTDGSNLKLAGNFVTTADDTITLVFDGTNFYEVARSVN